MKLARGSVFPLIAVALIVGLVMYSYVQTLKITNHVKVEYPSPPEPEPTPPPPPEPTIKIGVYTDSSCTASVTEIDWGSLYPKDSKITQAWIRNEGNVNVTVTLRTENWNPPEAEQFMELRCLEQPVDLIVLRIPVGIVMYTPFELTVFGNVTGISNFSFDTVLTVIKEGEILVGV